LRNNKPPAQTKREEREGACFTHLAAKNSKRCGREEEEEDGWGETRTSPEIKHVPRVLNDS